MTDELASPAYGLGVLRPEDSTAAQLSDLPLQQSGTFPSAMSNGSVSGLFESFHRLGTWESS